jgi:hypothetical protein
MSAPAPPRILVDRMLIRLGKYLRIIGCDVTWDTEPGSSHLLERARADGRILLTSSKRRGEESPRPQGVLWVEDIDPVFQFHRVVQELGIDPQAHLFSRCIRCNVPLEEAPDRESLRGRVDARVWERQHRFFTCPSCGTIFWYGSHVRNTCRKLGLATPPDGP